MGYPTKTRVILYRATNPINGKVYIGITERELSERRREHINLALSGRGKHPFSRAIRKYGAESFEWDILQTFMFAEDAMEAEIRCIKEIGRHRTYNTLKGGKGGGAPVTPEGRARISAFHKGKQWHLGRKHSEETRSILRKVGLKFRKSWLKRSHLGPEASAKPVVCLDNGMRYASASSAGRAYGIPKSQIIEVCNRVSYRRTAKNLVFRYEGDHHGGLAEANAERERKRQNIRCHSQKLRKRVRCINDGRIFASAKEAAETYNIHRSYIGEICRGEKTSSRGLLFEYVQDLDNVLAPARQSGSRSAETGSVGGM